MKIMFAASAASAALLLASAAIAQSQYGPPPGADPNAYADGGYGDQSADGDYDDQTSGYDQQGSGAPPAGPQGYGPPSTTHYPTNGYQRVPDGGDAQDMGPPPQNDPDGYADDMDPQDYSGGDYGQGGDGYPTDRGGYPGQNGYPQAWNNGAPPPPAAPGRGPAMVQPYGDAGMAAGIPADLLQREDRLERRIRHLDDRGAAPNYATDNLMIVLNSIRDQQEELSRRDNGLNFTDRRFIEGRLDRLEEQVRALR